MPNTGPKNLANIEGRSDDTGALVVVAGAASVLSGPLTNGLDILVKTDANGALLIVNR